MIANDLAALSVIELRRYVMKPGRRDDLIEIFEREFIESQEACGMLPIGHFRDLDDADAFVWFRGFPDMARRRRALEAFYVESDAWKSNRDAANDTMIDSDNVLLLRAARAGSGFDLRGLERAGTPSYVGAAVIMPDRAMTQADVEAFERDVLPDLQRDATRIAYFVTEEAENDFPRLPVRDERAFVVTGSCADVDRLDRFIEQLRNGFREAEFLRLEPASRSLYR